jgi:uncharacterized protein (TIGR03663 family)
METESGDIEKSAERNTETGTGAMSNAGSFYLADWLTARGCWLDVLILVLAAVLRFWALDLKPAHFDEGVNGYFVDEITKDGFYHYDPTNFHGPLHFYILFVMQTFFGRDIVVLRWPLALAGVACVALLLFPFRRHFSATTCRFAALAMAVSPGFVFYARYAIHETWLVLFLMLVALGIGGLWRDGTVRHLWMVGAGLAGAMMMKETWLIHVVAMALAVPTLRSLESFSHSAPLPWAAQRGTQDDAARVAAICLAIVLFFFSGCLIDPSGIAGFVEAFVQWTRTGMGNNSGHEKSALYWGELLTQYEWPLLIGVVGSVFVALPKTDRFLRWLAIGAVGALMACAIVAYKTPWCLIAWAWPFFLVFGAGVDRLMQRIDRVVIGGLAGVFLLISLSQSRTLNFERYADENEPYVYVQTTNDIKLLLDPLRWQAALDPETIFNVGHIIQPEHHPLLWLLGGRPNISWDDEHGDPEVMDADWLLVDSSVTERIEGRLSHRYFRTEVQIRGMAPDQSVLYLSAAAFQEYFPGREPEFSPEERAMDVEFQGGKLPAKKAEDNPQ